jgi:tetratricopeptide (TPR) repeat protein
MAKHKPNAETYRLRALAYLTAKDLSHARLEIKKAIELEPRWIRIRLVAAMIDYYSVLSPTMLPRRPVPWPEPVDWLVVKRDDENLQRLRDAAEVFQELSRTQNRNVEERRIYETWYLACLANDSEKQGQATEYCKNILQNDSAHYGAIVWAIARGYNIDLTSNVQSVESLVVDGTATISHVTALLSCYLSVGKAQDAINLLEQTHSLFVQNDTDIVWIFWRAQALIANGDPNAALAAIEASGASAQLRDAQATALRLIAKATGNWQPVIQHLEKSYEETQDPAFLLEICEVMAHQQNWTYISDRAEQIVQQIGTGEVVRLAALATYNAQRFELCLKLLDGYRNWFKNSQLPNELRELRIACHHVLGVLPEAISEAEALGHEAPTTQNLYRLAQLYIEKGDLKNVAIVARRLSEHPDLLPEQAFQIAGLIRWDDLPLAQSIWRKVASTNPPDSMISATIGLGYQLGLDKELKSLVERMMELGQKGLGGIQVMTVDELIAFAKQDTGRAQAIEESYRTGTAPTHAIAELVNQPLVNFYHDFLAVNEINPDPLRQNYLMARHGGHALVQGFWETPTKWRLNLDISAVLLANHLDILASVEQIYAPLRIPAELIPTLLYMRDKVAHHQPSRFQAYRQIIELVQNGLLTISNSKLPSHYPNTLLVEELGEDWVALFETARANNGYVVDFLPLHKRDLSGPPTALPADAQNYVINCRMVADALRAQGPFSDTEYQSVLEELGQEGPHSPGQVIPQESAPLYCDRGILEVLAKANALAIACQHFRVKIEQRELDGIRAALHYEDNIQSADDWLSGLIGRIRDGIDKGIYVIIPIPQHKANELEEVMSSYPYTDCTRPLLLFEPHEGDAIWIDDRFFNGYFHRDGIPIIGINEVLKALVSVSKLSIKEYYEKLHRLRAANVRFIPLEDEEILYYLRQARIEKDAVVETSNLSVLRRYIATCLLQGGWLQKPAFGTDIPNPEGETAFILGLSHAIANALAKVWNAQEDTKICEAQSNWIVSGLFLDHLSLLDLTALQRPNQDDRYVVGVSFAGLISRALLLRSERNKSLSSARKRYLEWLYGHVIYSRVRSDPLLLATIADFLKKSMSDSKEELMTRGPELVTMSLLQEFFEDLPEPIQEEVARDTDFMASIGFKFTIDVAGIRFDPDIYWRAVAEAVNGREVPIVAVKPHRVVTFEPGRISGEQIGFCFEHPATGQKMRIRGTDYGLLVESPIEQEKFLRKNSAWFDCSSEVFERAIADIVSTTDPAQRVEKVVAWRNTSATVYYEDLEINLRKESGFNLRQLIPENAEGLLRHFRLTIDPASADTHFRDMLISASRDLIEQNGLQTALERFARLPVALPQPLLERVGVLPPDEIRATIKNLIRQSGSPVSQLHCLHLLSKFGYAIPAFSRLARRIIKMLVSDQRMLEFEAFRAVLQWVNVEFQHKLDMSAWPVHMRLALAWAHSHQLYIIFSSAGAPENWLKEHFSEIGRATAFEVFDRDPDYWFDIAHPRRVGYVQFVLTGLAYAIGDNSLLTGDESLRDIFEVLAFHEVEGKRLPDLSLLQNITSAKNSLDSFLGNRAELLSKLLKPDDVRVFAQSSLLKLVEEAIDALAQENADQSAWATIYTVLGDFAPEEQLIDRLRSIIQTANFLELFIEDRRWGNLALQAAAAQIYYLQDDAIRQHLTDELIRIGRTLAVSGTNQTGTTADGVLERNKVEGFLLEVILKISLANTSPNNAPKTFGEVVMSLVDAWPMFASTATVVIQQLYERLPIHQAKQLYMPLVRLRATPARSINL